MMPKLIETTTRTTKQKTTPQKDERNGSMSWAK